MENNLKGLKDDFGQGLESLLDLLEPLEDDQNRFEEALGIEPSRSASVLTFVMLNSIHCMLGGIQ